uniref:Aminotransferase-like plant mobile domain-containing protein n=1 Tax=Fagus sylvatica TaxID=28930 RepID=A0A2N9IRV3_FAGSY
MLSANQENHVIEKLSLFEKLSILDLGEFGISGKLTQNCGLQNKDCQSDFLVSGLFSDVDFRQLGNALDETRQPDSRGAAERASHKAVEELQRHYDAGGDDVASALGITIQELIQPFVVAAVAGSTKAPTRGGRMAPRRVVAPKRRRASKRTSETLEIDLEVVEPRKRYPHEGGACSSLHGTRQLYALKLSPGEGLYKRYFHHIGAFHLSTCEMGMLLLDWSAILGIRFEGRIPPREPISHEEAMVMLGIDDLSAFVRTNKVTLKFIVYWVFEHFPTSRPSMLRPRTGVVFPLARCWDVTRIERMTIRTLLEHRSKVDCIRDSYILFQPYDMRVIVREEMDIPLVVPIDLPTLLTIEDYAPPEPRDAYRVGVDSSELCLAGLPYLECVQLRLGGELERLPSEVTRLRSELDGSETRMSTTSTTFTGGTGTSTQGPCSSPDHDYRGWLDGDYQGPDLP